ncbi:MAG: RluA family pseudouridine synthase [Treponemataceae bacterium]
MIKILYQDEFLIVIEKPSGLLSVPYPGNTGKNAALLIESLMRKTGTYSKYHRPYAVHRLDKDTGGVMMFCLNEKTQKIFIDNWKKIITTRRYIALAENPSSISLLSNFPKEGTIADNLAFNNYNMGYVPKNAKNCKTVKAVTHYKIIEQGKRYTLFQLELDTGRKNQIRAHLASKGFCIAGDKNYKAKTDPLGRLALHAKTLEFIHPVTKEKLKFEVPESTKWKELCKK